MGQQDAQGMEIMRPFLLAGQACVCWLLLDDESLASLMKCNTTPISLG